MRMWDYAKAWWKRTHDPRRSQTPFIPDVTLVLQERPINCTGYVGMGFVTPDLREILCFSERGFSLVSMIKIHRYQTVFTLSKGSPLPEGIRPNELSCRIAKDLNVPVVTLIHNGQQITDRTSYLPIKLVPKNNLTVSQKQMFCWIGRSTQFILDYNFGKLGASQKVRCISTVVNERIWYVGYDSARRQFFWSPTLVAFPESMLTETSIAQIGKQLMQDLLPDTAYQECQFVVKPTVELAQSQKTVWVSVPAW